jgi:hypothetical protein
MNSYFENTALTIREPKARLGRRCASTQLVHGTAEIRAWAARSLPKSDSQRGSRFPGAGEPARGVTLQGREQLVHRDTFLATPALGATTAFVVRVFAPRVWAPSARLRPCAVRSTAGLTAGELAVGAAA